MHSASTHPEHGGRPIVAAAIGVALALPIWGIFYFHPDGAFDLLTLILAFTGGIYTGAALRAEVGRGRLALEWALGAALVLVAALSLWWAPWWLAVGFGAHGLWDMAHHARQPGLGVRRWFPPFCAAFDFAAAALVVFYAP